MERIFERFDVTKEGKVIRLKDNKEMKCYVDKDGYVIFGTNINGEKVQVKVHRLVATKYLENQNNYKQVNHINGIKTDNRVENLEWCDSKHNMNHAYETGLCGRRKKVKQIDKTTGETLATYDSQTEASKITGVAASHISAVCSKYKPKNRKTARETTGGFKWEYV